MISPSSTCEILLCDSRGIYIPKNFYDDFDLPAWGIDKDKFTALSDPDNEWYWEAWNDLITKAKYTDALGHTWTLQQEGDLFAYRDDHKFERKEE